MASHFLTIPQFAEEYGVSTATAWRMIKRGDVIKSQPGGDHHAVRIPREELERLKAGEPLNGGAPVLQDTGVPDSTTTEQEQLPGPKPKWLR